MTKGPLSSQGSPMGPEHRDFWHPQGVAEASVALGEMEGAAGHGVATGVLRRWEAGGGYGVSDSVHWRDVGMWPTADAKSSIPVP